jgi:hypothetical protein
LSTKQALAHLMIALQVCLLSTPPGSAPNKVVDTISTHVDAFITNASPSSKFLKISRYA